MNIKLSIILPCYNVSKYITQCLNSIFSQNISEQDFEVICVNDCSTDNTAEIIQLFQTKHKNLILLHHDVNKNLGASRNTGFRHARGKYVWFVDSDDYLADNCLAVILSELETCTIEIIEINSHLTQPQTNPLFIEANYKSDSEVITGIEYLSQLIKTPYWGRKVEVWRRIFSSEFLRKNNFIFSETLFGVEDVIFFYKTLFECQKFKHLSTFGYFYRNDSVNSMTNSCNNRGLKLAVRIIVTLEVIEFFRKDSHINDPEFKQKAIGTYQWSFNQFIRKIYLLDSENLSGYFAKIEPYNSYIRKQLIWYKAFLISNRLLLKGIMVIFAPLKKIHNFTKKLK